MRLWLWASAAWYRFSGWLLPILLRLLGRLEVEHADRVPREGPLVIVANHLNIIDPILVCAVTPRRLRPMAKRELFETPLVGWLCWLYGAFPVRRFSADLGALRAGRNHLRAGEAVLVHPEGTRSRTYELPAGAARLRDDGAARRRAGRARRHHRHRGGHRPALRAARSARPPHLDPRRLRRAVPARRRRGRARTAPRPPPT